MNIEEIGLTVLLLASQARLLELFRSLEAQGMLQLQVASNIADAEQLLSQCPPDFAFVQSRVSALSGEIVLRHVRSLVAENSKVVLLSGDEEELKKARTLEALALNLGISDESLRYAVRELLATAERPAPAAAAEVPVEEPAPEIAVATAEEPSPAAEEAAAPPKDAPSAVAEEEPSFRRALEQTLRAQQAHEEQEAAAAAAPHQLAAAEHQHGVPRKRRSSMTAPARSLRDFASKRYLSPRRHRRTLLAIAGILAFAAGAASWFITTEEPTPPARTPLPARSAAPPVQEAAPETKPPPAEVATPAPQPKGAQAPAPTGLGLTDLPPFVVDAEQDAEYGKTHPGWERYLTSRMEYKIFREGNLIKSVQVMAARDETVPPDIFNWARKEFARAGAQRLESKEKKGNYQVEKWQADGAGLTVYRRLPELKMRALVLYFR